MRVHFKFIVAGILVLSLCSCNRPSVGTVTGTVTHQGKPLGGIEINFFPLDGQTEGLGYAKADGKYELYYGRGVRQLPAGEYRVTLTPTSLVEGAPKPTVKFPRDLGSKDSSPVVREIKAGSNVIDIDLDPLL